MPNRVLIISVALLAAACEPIERGDGPDTLPGRAVEGGVPVEVETLTVSGGGHLIAGDSLGRIHQLQPGGASDAGARVVWTGHAGPASAVARTDDGGLISFGRDGAFRVHDAEGRPLARPLVPDPPVSDVLFARDGRRALSWDGLRSRGNRPTFCGPRDSTLSLRDGAARPLAVLSYHARCAAFSADGQRGVFTAEGEVVAFDSETGAAAGRARLAPGTDAQGIAISDTGDRVAVVAGGTLHLIDVASGSTTARAGGHSLLTGGRPVAFTPDGGSVVATVSSQDGARVEVALFDSRTGAPQGVLLPDAPTDLRALTLTPAGDLVYLARAAGDVRGVRLADGRPAPPVRLAHWAGDSVSVASVAGRVAICGGGEVQLRSFPDGALTAWFRAPAAECGPRSPVALSPDGRAILLSPTGPAPFVARDQTGTVIARFDRPHNATIHAPTWSPNGQWVAAAVIQPDRARLAVWPAAGGAPAGLAQLPPIGQLTSLVVRDDGQRLIASYAHLQPDGGPVGEVGAFDLERPDNTLWARAGPLVANPGQLALLDGGARVAYVGIADDLLVLDADSGALLERLRNSALTVWTYSRFGTVGLYSTLPRLSAPQPEAPAFNTLAVSASDRLVAVTAYNRSNVAPMLQVFDREAGDLRRFVRVTNYPRALAFVGETLWAIGLQADGGDLVTFAEGAP